MTHYIYRWEKASEAAKSRFRGGCHNGYVVKNVFKFQEPDCEMSDSDWTKLVKDLMVKAKKCGLIKTIAGRYYIRPTCKGHHIWMGELTEWME